MTRAGAAPIGLVDNRVALRLALLALLFGVILLPLTITSTLFFFGAACCGGYFLLARSLDGEVDVRVTSWVLTMNLIAATYATLAVTFVVRCENSRHAEGAVPVAVLVDVFYRTRVAENVRDSAVRRKPELFAR